MCLTPGVCSTPAHESPSLDPGSVPKDGRRGSGWDRRWGSRRTSRERGPGPEQQQMKGCAPDSEKGQRGLGSKESGIQGSPSKAPCVPSSQKWIRTGVAAPCGPRGAHPALPITSFRSHESPLPKQRGSWPSPSPHPAPSWLWEPGRRLTALHSHLSKESSGFETEGFFQIRRSAHCSTGPP